ncbi:MAG: virulence RhuM family protein [Paramuribaculum sp.]|nr:virulence RhuM family protein [Paramuribaculum sp.]
MAKENEIIIYQPDSSFSLEVRIENETVWLNRQQMADLFQRDRTVIGRHINNIFKEGELEESLVCAKFAHTKDYGRRTGFTQNIETEYYSLDVIISVGYRVKSIRGTQFRQWANKVLKEYLLTGYSVNQRYLDLENRINHRFHLQQKQIDNLTDKVDFVINSSIRPKEVIIFDGQIWDAHNFATNLIKEAKEKVILIDNYIDNTVLTQLDNRGEGVEAIIYTGKINPQLTLDIERHNQQYPAIEVKKVRNIHDRFLIIDNEIYHLGASLKDLGKKLFAFIKMETSPDYILDNIKTEEI